VIKKWLENRYLTLWAKMKDSPFGFGDAKRILSEKFEDADDVVNTVLSELRKSGHLSVEPDPKDARKKIYKIKSREGIISTLLDKELTRGDLEGLLKKAADLIRTRVDYTFILILLFYKRISDKWEKEYSIAYKEAIKDGLSDKEFPGQ
jgi:type I restriction enzyme M protein